MLLPPVASAVMTQQGPLALACAQDMPERQVASIIGLLQAVGAHHKGSIAPCTRWLSQHAEQVQVAACSSRQHAAVQHTPCSTASHPWPHGLMRDAPR